jgi:hypothetical protein
VTRFRRFHDRRLFSAKPASSAVSLKGAPVSLELAIELKQLLFGNANRDFPPGWKNQVPEGSFLTGGLAETMRQCHSH